MASRKADYDGLKVQDFLNKAQAMAYTNYPTEVMFNEDVLPYVHCYKSGKPGGQFYVPELRSLILSREQLRPTKL
jgi:hypothetical protein